MSGQFAAKRYRYGHQRVEKATESCIHTDGHHLKRLLGACYETEEAKKLWATKMKLTLFIVKKTLH